MDQTSPNKKELHITDFIDGDNLGEVLHGLPEGYHELGRSVDELPTGIALVVLYGHPDNMGEDYVGFEFTDFINENAISKTQYHQVLNIVQSANYLVALAKSKLEEDHFK